MKLVRIKLPAEERSAEIVLEGGHVHFHGDGTCTVPLNTLRLLDEANIQYERVPDEGGEEKKQ
jgi:agmatine/peptidylarginine deiminase